MESALRILTLLKVLSILFCASEMYADEEFVTPVCRAFNEGMQLFFLMLSIKIVSSL